MRKEWDMFEGMFELFGLGFLLSLYGIVFAFIYLVVAPSISSLLILTLIGILAGVCSLAWNDLNRFRIWCIKT